MSDNVLFSHHFIFTLYRRKYYYSIRDDKATTGGMFLGVCVKYRQPVLLGKWWTSARTTDQMLAHLIMVLGDIATGVGVCSKRTVYFRVSEYGFEKR